jgi:hypothetical protein
MPPKNCYSGIARELVAAATLDSHSSLGSAIIGFNENNKQLLIALAWDIYNALGPLDQEMVRQHSEFAKRVVHLWWFGALAFHLQSDDATLAEFRNDARRQVIADWPINNPGKPFPPYLVRDSDFEEVPPPRPVGARPGIEVPDPDHKWLPYPYAHMFKPCGDYTLGTNERLTFTLRADFPLQLVSPGLKKSFTYIIKDPSLRVVKIGKGDNDLGGSAKSTIERYRRLPKKVVGKPRKYGSRTGPAAIMRKRMLAARAAAAAAQQEGEVSCCLWVYFLPDVMVPPDVMDQAHVKLGAGGLEQPLVRAYVLGHNGEYPAGNVQEKGGKHRSWAAAAVALGLYTGSDDED